MQGMFQTVHMNYLGMCFERKFDFFQYCPYRSIVELCDKIQKAGNVNDSELSRRFRTSIPSSSRIRQYVDFAQFFTLREYMEIYDTPLESQFDGDNIWPMTRLFTY